MSACVSASLTSLPYELMEPVIGELEPVALQSLALTCKQLCELITSPITQEFQQVSILEDDLIEKMQALSLEETVAVPKTKYKFNARKHAEIVIPLYSEVFGIAKDIVSRFVFKTLDDHEKALFCNPAYQALLENLHAVLPEPQDEGKVRRIKSSQRFPVIEELLRNKMTTLVQFITEREQEMMEQHIDG